MSANSFTGEPGSMPYDRDAAPERPTNARCPECGTRYWKGRDDWGGDLCTPCADAAWMEEKDRRQRQMAARVAAELQKQEQKR